MPTTKASVKATTESTTESTTKYNKPLKRLWRKITAYLLLAITGLLCFVAIIYSSPWGARIATKAINEFTPLSLIYKKGMLSETIVFTSVKLNNDNIALLGSNVALKFHLRCIWENKLCIDSLAVDKLSLKVLSQPNSENKPNNTDTKPVSLPIAIKADKFTVRSATIETANQSINIERFSSAINIKKQTFTFSTPTISSLNVTYNSAVEQSVKSEPVSLKKSTAFSQIELPEIDFPINLNVQRLSLNKLIVQNKQSIEPSLALTNTKLSGRWFKKEIIITSLSTEHEHISPINIEGYLHTTKNYPLKFKISTAIQSNNIWPDIENSKQAIQLNGDLSALSFTGKSTGPLSLLATGSVNLRDLELPYTIEVDAQKLPLYSDVSDVIHPSSLKLASEGNLKEQYLSVSSVINGLGYTNAKVSFKGTHSNQNTKKVSIDTFTLKDSKNDIKVSGNVTLSDKPKWNLNIDSKGFNLPTTQYVLFGEHLTGYVKGKLNTYGVFDREKTTVTVSNTNLSGLINNVPFTAIGNMDLQKNWKLSPSDLTISVFDSLVKIKGYNDSQWHVTGKIQTPKLSAFVPKLNGKLNTSFKVSGPLKDPIIEFSHTIENIKYDDWSSPLISSEGTYSPFQNHKVVADIESAKINGANIAFTHLTSTINGDLNKQHITLDWHGDLNSKLTIDGLWDNKSNLWDATISAAEINYLNMKWLPNKSIDTRYDHNKKEVSIAAHCWENIGFNVCLPKNVLLGESGNIPLKLSMNTSVLNEPFIPKDLLVNTTISGDVNVNWGKKTYEIVGDLTILAGNILLEDSKLGLPVEILSAWDKGQFTFTINNELAKTNLLLSPNAGSTAWFYSTVNMLANIQLNNNYAISGLAKISNLNIRPLATLSHNIAQVDGTLNSDVKLTGTLYKPNATGTVKVTDALFKLIKSPTIFESGLINIDLLGDNAKINGSFNVNKDTALISGDASWIDEKWLNLNVSSDKLSLLLPPQVEATIAPNIDIKLTKNALKLTGQINVLSGILEVNKLPEGSVELSKDVVFVDNDGKQIVKESVFNIETDIKLFIAEQFKLSGQGFEGTLEGALHIQHGSNSPLQIFGNLIIPGGRYHAYGQRLQVEKGKISFNGPTDNPYVDLRATRAIPKDDVKVGVEIIGLANSLALNLISTPSMTRAEVLSYLLRGQALDLDNPDNSGVGAALGAALANYSGVLKQIEKLPLVNNVEIEGSSEQVSIAGYIGKKVYVKYGVGVEELGDELTIRLFLMSRLWLETISGLENSIDIYYSFDTNL